MCRLVLLTTVLLLTGCVSRPSDRQEPTLPSQATTAAAAAAAATMPFGARYVALGCADGAGGSDDPPAPSDSESPIRLAPGTTAYRAADVNLRLPPGIDWYFVKAPMTVHRGAADLTLTVSGPDQALAWVPAGVWTSGHDPDLGTWAARSVTMHSCPDRTIQFLGGFLAASTGTCLVLTTLRAGRTEHTVHQRLDGSPCTG